MSLYDFIPNNKKKKQTKWQIALEKASDDYILRRCIGRYFAFCMNQISEAEFVIKGRKHPKKMPKAISLVKEAEDESTTG